MSLLQFVERHLGLIYFWPRNIIKQLFIDPPTYPSTMTLIKFFYGNGIPVEIAVQLFRACNDEATFDQTQHFFYYYSTWQNQEDATHLGIYYNMSINKHVYINGSRKNNSKLSTCLLMNQVDLATCGHYLLGSKLMLFSLVCATTESKLCKQKHAIKT